MIRWQKCRSYLLRADRSFQHWADGLPEWGLWLLLPPITLVPMVEWAGHFRRTTAVVAVTFVAMYVPLIRSGALAFSWGGALSGLGAVVGLLYLVVACIGLMFAWQRALWRLTAGKKSPEGTGAAFRLWDREIDG